MDEGHLLCDSTLATLVLALVLSCVWLSMSLFVLDMEPAHLENVKKKKPCVSVNFSNHPANAHHPDRFSLPSILLLNADCISQLNGRSRFFPFWLFSVCVYVWKSRLICIQYRGADKHWAPLRDSEMGNFSTNFVFYSAPSPNFDFLCRFVCHLLFCPTVFFFFLSVALKSEDSIFHVVPSSRSPNLWHVQKERRAREIDSEGWLTDVGPPSREILNCQIRPPHNETRRREFVSSSWVNIDRRTVEM